MGPPSTAHAPISGALSHVPHVRWALMLMLMHVSALVRPLQGSDAPASSLPRLDDEAAREHALVIERKLSWPADAKFRQPAGAAAPGPVPRGQWSWPTPSMPVTP